MTKVDNGITLSKNFGNGERGSYILLIELPEAETITIGRLRGIYFRRGHYAYVGSAMGGFKARLERHLKVNKKPRWHIDYLLAKASINSIVVCPTQHRIECPIAQALSPHFEAIPHFGSSDCQCPSHLFFATDNQSMKRMVMSITRLIIPESRQLTRQERKGGSFTSFQGI